ncbi:MAG TPA: hypothetical protein VK763_04585 [Terriglobales bacterium]|nr:hypothetical protein [Terriglobales bacterium]
MKLGTENRNKLIAAATLGVIALVLVARMLFPSAPSEPDAPVVAPVVTAAPPSRPAGKSHGGARRLAAGPPHSIDPSLRYDWLKASEDTKYEGNGRNIFLAQAEIPQPVAPGQTDAEKEKAKGPPPPPPPPPINLKFYGFASKPGEPKKVFLSQGEDVFIASEGEIVDRRYKVLHISPVSVEIEDVLSNNRQMIPLSQS